MYELSINYSKIAKAIKVSDFANFVKELLQVESINVLGNNSMTIIIERVEVKRKEEEKIV